MRLHPRPAGSGTPPASESVNVPERGFDPKSVPPAPRVGGSSGALAAPPPPDEDDVRSRRPAPANAAPKDNRPRFDEIFSVPKKESTGPAPKKSVGDELDPPAPKRIEPRGNLQEAPNPFPAPNKNELIPNNAPKADPRAEKLEVPKPLPLRSP